MAQFKYRASDAFGKIAEGSIDAPNAKTAAESLAATGLIVLSINTAGNGANGETEVRQTAKKAGGEKVALALVKKLSQLCGRGGMPVGDALKSLAARSLDPKIKSLARELYADLSEGKTLAAAMRKFPDTFDASTTHLVEAGESTANLGFVFDNIVAYILERKKLRAAVFSALAYPVFLCVLATGVVMLFLFFMLPKIESMMANMGAEKNFPIRMMEFIGDALVFGAPAIAVFAALCAAAVALFRNSESGARKCDGAMLKMPIIGGILRDADICRFANLSATLSASGVNATETFRLAEKSISNRELRARFRLFRTAVNDGAPVSAALHKFGLLDDEDIDVVSVGERTGSLVEAFSELSAAHSETLKKRISTATTALGGAALGTAFLLVFVFASGIVLSILSLSQSIGAK